MQWAEWDAVVFQGAFRQNLGTESGGAKVGPAKVAELVDALDLGSSG